jgi:hypothetical protein
VVWIASLLKPLMETNSDSLFNKVQQIGAVRRCSPQARGVPKLLSEQMLKQRRLRDLQPIRPSPNKYSTPWRRAELNRDIALYAKGIFCEGTFMPAKEAATLSKAAHFRAGL